MGKSKKKTIETIESKDSQIREKLLEKNLENEECKPLLEIDEYLNEGYNPCYMILLLITLIISSVILSTIAYMYEIWWFYGVAVLALIVAIFIIWKGFFTVETNKACVMTLCGKYKGTSREPGLHWIPNWYKKEIVDLGLNNFETPQTKVNDKDGTPVLIQAVVSYRIKDTAQSSFQMEFDWIFMFKQAIAALREVCTNYAYDSADSSESTLTNSKVKVAQELKAKMQEYVRFGGIEIVDARISELNYAHEIAASMLKRQQAQATLGVKTKIVEGALGMAVDAIEKIEAKGMANLSIKHKQQLLSKLLIILSSNQNEN